MNDKEITDLLSGDYSAKVFTDSLLARGISKYRPDNDLTVSSYSNKKDPLGNLNEIHINKDYTDYGEGMYSSKAEGSDSKMPSSSISIITSKLHELSPEALFIIQNEAAARIVSILDVILEKARDRVIQPDMLDEMEQKAVEDKFSKIPDIGKPKNKFSMKVDSMEKYTAEAGAIYDDWASSYTESK